MRYSAEQVAYLVGKMDTVNEGGTTLLDNSMAFWCSEVSYAASHTYTDMRAFVFGSGGGKIHTGQHLEFNAQARMSVSLM